MAGIDAGLAIAMLLAAASLLLSSAGPGMSRWQAVAATNNRRLDIRGAEPNTDGRATDAAALLDLIGAMLDAGASLERSLAVLAGITGGRTGAGLAAVSGGLRLGADWQTAWMIAGRNHPDRGLEELRTALSFAAGTGAPTASILYAQATQLRRSRYRETERRAAALGVRLVIPLGLCSLPAFICLGVLPVFLALLPQLGP